MSGGLSAWTALADQLVADDDWAGLAAELVADVESTIVAET